MSQQALNGTSAHKRQFNVNMKTISVLEVITTKYLIRVLRHLDLTAQQGPFVDTRLVGAGVDGKVVSVDGDTAQLVHNEWHQSLLHLLHQLHCDQQRRQELQTT